MVDPPRRRSTDIGTVISAVLRALSIAAPALLIDAPVALAQPYESRTLATDIPGQPIARALEAFAHQTHLQVIYISGVVRAQRSRAVSAGMSANDALALMLGGTGLNFEYLTSRSIRIFAAVVAPPPEAIQMAPIGIELQEIVVTANRREENLEDVPMTIQVLTSGTLAKLNATTFDDFVMYLPGVTAQGVGPGQNNIYMRGLSTGDAGLQTAGIVGIFPSVAVYLDEQSAQLPGRNLDIYAADLDRVEILEGPQGTLFGAGAEAGVVRYITNKPRLNITEGNVNAGYATTAHGSASSSVDATINIPVIADKLAVRAVIYNERRGGYINNIPATFARSDTDGGIGYANAGGKVPANSVVLNNFALAGNDINPVVYEGIRAGVLYQFQEGWNALLTQSYQSIEADGVFAEMTSNSLGQPQPDLTAQLYNPSYNKDKFENTALTLDGRIGDLKLLYAGAYLVRNVEQVQDYTQYARGLYVDYYQCANPGPTPVTAQCFSPGSTWRDVERNTHQSQEVRITTPADRRVRAVTGLFYDDYLLQEQVDWFYVTATPYFNPIGPPTGYYTLNGAILQPNGARVSYDTPGAVFVPGAVTLNNPNVRPLGDGTFHDTTREYKQKAAYASIDFELIPALTLTAGTRYSGTEGSEVGVTVGSTGCQLINNPSAPNPCINHSNFHNLNSLNLDKTYSGFSSRANLSWKASPEALLYYTWSQGSRAGAFNRPIYSGGYSPLTPGSYPWQAQARAHGGFRWPLYFAPDSLTNNELGWKTSWQDHRVQWDGAVYQEDWKHVQVPLYGYYVSSYGAVTANGGNYRVRGLETSVAARIGSGVTIDAAVAWNHSELVKEAPFAWADGTPIDFTSLRTPTGQQAVNPTGTIGSPLAGAPPFQGNARARYDFTYSSFDGFVQIGVVHQSHSFASTDRISVDLQGNSIAYDLPPFTTYAAAVGAGKNGWLTQIYGENLTDTRAELYANSRQWYKAVTVSRPRTIGLRFSYKFKE